MLGSCDVDSSGSADRQPLRAPRGQRELLVAGSGCPRERAWIRRIGKSPQSARGSPASSRADLRGRGIRSHGSRPPPMGTGRLCNGQRSPGVGACPRRPPSQRTRRLGVRGGLTRELRVRPPTAEPHTHNDARPRPRPRPPAKCAKPKETTRGASRSARGGGMSS